MAQIAKVIDITRSFLPIDPNSFPENMMFTAQEDSPEKEPPVVAIDGYNFLPTAYGYRSYFGFSASFDIQPLPSRCDKVLLFQLDNFQNVLIALCEEGIYWAAGSAPLAAWTQAVSYFLPPAGTYVQWTYALIENTLYFYRQGTADVWYLGYTDYREAPFTLDFASFTPTFLNMAGQMGIFRANGRLGFWDSDNSISWSSLFDHQDFSPAIETLAGNAIFNSVIGRIVTILPQGEGFIIYATKSIVGVRYSNASVNILWEAIQITSESGIVYPFQVTHGLTELEQFAFTNTGIKKIGNYNALQKSHALEEVLPELFDRLKETKDIVRLDFLGGRFLFFSLVNPYYIDGNVLAQKATADAYTVRIMSGRAAAPDLNIKDIRIGASAYTSLLEHALGQGYTTGMFLWWTATGQAMVPDRISPINPYVLDTNFALIPNTPPAYDTSSLLHIQELLSLVEGGSFSAPTPESVSLNNGGKLGISHYFPQSAGDAALGGADNHLSWAVAKQREEWANYKTILQNTYTAINSVGLVAGRVIQGTTLYSNRTKAEAALELFIAAELVSHSGAYREGNSVIWEEDAGVLPAPISTSNQLDLPDIGRYFASASLTENFIGGYPIKRTVRRNFSFRPGDTFIDAIAFVLGMEALLPEVKAALIEAVSGIIDGINGPSSGVVNPYYYGHVYVSPYYPPGAESDAQVLALAQQIPLPPTIITEIAGVTYTYHSPMLIPRSGGVLVRYTVDIRASNGISWRRYYEVVLVSETREVLSYFIDHKDTKSLSLGAYDPNLSSFDSTLEAEQKDLTYGLSTPSNDKEFIWTDGAVTVPGSSLQGYDATPPFDFTYPGVSFLLQDGSLAPIYPEYQGAYVLDLALKKWGKMKGAYTALVDYSPINTLQSAIPYSNFGLDMGILTSSGELYLADSKPADSYILYGKIGYYRLGMTELEEIRVQFRFNSTGQIAVATSLDGRNLELGREYVVDYVDVNNVVVYPELAGRWHIVKVSGNYDLSYLEVRGNIRGRR